MKKFNLIWIAAAGLAALDPALASQGPPPASVGNQPVGGCYSTCGGDVPWPLEVSNQQVELADGARYLLIGTVEMNAGRAYFIVDLAKQPWLSNPRRRQNPRYPLSGNVEYWEAYAGKRVRIAGMAQWSVVREVDARQYRVDVVLRSLADPAVLVPGAEEGAGGSQGISDSSGRKSALWD